MNEDLDKLRQYAKLAEDKEKAVNAVRSVGIVTDCRNDLKLNPEIIQAAYAAGIDQTSEASAELMRNVSKVIEQLASVICNLGDVLMEIFNEVWPWAITIAEEIQKLIEQCEYADEPEKPDRHDGAVVVPVTWLLPVPSLYELYGQGVDHGGPGPSRLMLTRITDDGLWRAETGTTRKGEHDDHFYEHSAGSDRLRAVSGHRRRKGQHPPQEDHYGLHRYPGGDRSDQFRGVTKMKKYKGYDLVEAADLEAAITWAKNIRAEDPEKEPEIKTLRDVLVTGLTYARVVAANMGGLPCFAEDQTPEERQKAMRAAAAMARRPDGGAGKNRGKKGAK